MDNQNQLNPEKSDDLISADARAFINANELSSDDKDRVSSESLTPSTDKDARIMQAVNRAQALRAENYKRTPVLLYIGITVVVVLIIAVSLALSSKPQNNSGSANSSGGLSVPTPASSDTQGLSNQAQQDIKTCSNVINATIEC